MVAKEAVEAYAAYLEQIGVGEEVEFEALVAAHPACASDLVRLHRRREALEGQLFAPRPRERTAGERRAAREALRPVLQRFADRTGFQRRYRFLGRVQEGGMGRVVRVFDRDLRRVLAMKLLADAPDSGAGADGLDAPRAARLLEEAQITAQLDHPGIPPIHEVGLTPEGELYFTMKWITSERTLADVIEELHAPSGSNEWSLPRVLALVQRAGEAVAFAHDHGVIHRDLKPANVLVGDLGEVYVSDWGVALALGPEKLRDQVPRPEAGPRPVRTQRSDRKRATPSTPLRTLEGHTVGTPEYMSPEQARGEGLDARSDVYAMGALLLHVFTGRPPTPLAPAREALEALSRSPRRVPPELEAIVARAMALAPADRYSDMRALVRDLAAFQEGRVVQAYRTGALVELQKWVRRNKGTALASGLAVAAFVGGALLTSWAVRAEKEQKEQRARAQIQLATHALVRGDSRAKAVLGEVPAEERNWEWRHLMARSDSSRSVVKSEAAVVRAFPGPDGEVAWLTVDGKAQRWSGPEGVVRQSFYSDSEVLAADRSGDGRWFGTLGKTLLAVRSAIDGSAHPLFAPRNVPDGKSGRTLAFSPDGLRLAALAGDARLRVFGLDGGSTLDVASSGAENALAWVDAERVACAGSEGRVRVWNALTGKPVREWKVPGTDIKTPLTSLAAHAGGQRIAVGDSGGGIWLWSAEGRLEGHLTGHEEAVLSLAFDRTGERLASGSADHAVRLWDRTLRTELAVWAGHEGPVRHVTFDSSGAQVWSVAEDGTVRAWSVEQEPGLTTLGTALYPLWCLSFSPDSRRVAVGSTANDLSLWDVASAQRIATLRGHKDRISAVRWTPDGSAIVTGSADRTLAVWDVATRSRSRVLEGHRAEVTGVAIGAGGSRCVSSSSDGTLRRWDLRSGESRVLHEGANEIGCVALSPDGSRIAAGTSAGHLLYGPEAALRSYPITAKPIACLAFSPDGRLALGGDDGLFLWDPGSERLMRHWFPFDVIEGVAFSADGSRLASAALDSQLVRLCDPEREEPVASFEVPARLYDLAFAHDGEARIGTVDGNGKLRLWETRTPGALEELRREPRERSARLEPLNRRLFDEHLRLAEVLGAIDALPDLSPEDRGALRTLAEARGDDAALTGSEALDIVVRPADEEWDPLESTCRHASLSIL